VLDSLLSHFTKKEIFVIVGVLGNVSGMLIIFGFKWIVVRLWNLIMGRETEDE